MELHQSLEYKRPGVYTGADAPVLSSPFDPSFHIPLVDSGLTPLPFNFQVLPPQQSIASYGFASGHYIHNSQLEHSRKRRKLDKHTAMSSDSASSSGEGYSMKFSPSSPYDSFDPDQTSYLPVWAESTGSFGHAMTSPLAWAMDWSKLICPNCTTGRRQSDGYQSVPETAEVGYDPDRPFFTDKQPSMQMPLSDGYNSVPQAPTHHTSFCYSQPTLAPNSLDGCPVPDPVPLSVHTEASNQHSLSVPAYYPDQLSKQAAQYAHQPTYMMGPVQSIGQPSIPYGPAPLAISSSPPMPPQDNVSPDGLCQYTLAPDCSLVETVSPEGWDAPLHDQQAGFDILLPNQRGGKRGPFKDPGLREQTAQTRKMGSCIRCRMQRIRCEHNPNEPGGPCLTCKKVTSTKTGRFPCLRYKITDIRLYKPGQVPGYEWTRRWNNSISDPVQQWASDETRTIRISDGYSKKFMELRVRKFVPQDGDKLERTWDYRGSKRSVTIPPYALTELDGGKEAYSQHIESSIEETVQKVLGHADQLLFGTYKRAWQMFKDPSTPEESLELLRLTMRLWMAIRLSTMSVVIVGDEKLGMPSNILDDTSSDPGKIPIPPVLGAQLDLILIQHIQTKLRRELLDKLQKTILKNKHSTWFVTYLVTFILLHNMALITAHDAKYARKHGMKRRFAREDKVREYHLGANILLAHFHYCNKGAHPFSDECRDLDLQSRAELNDDELQFVRATRSYAKRYKREWETLRDQGQYEHDYFFVSQLFEDNWQPRSMP